MQKLLNLNPVKKSSDVIALRKLHDDCEVQVRSLDSMGLVSDTYGSLLCLIKIERIPEDIALAFSQERDEDDTLNVKYLKQFLQKEAESRGQTVKLTKSDSAQKERQRNESKIPFQIMGI